MRQHNLKIFSWIFLVVALLGTLLYFLRDSYLRKKLIVTPDFSSEGILSYRAGIRPYRRGGIRLELEHFQDKLIIHDYGHGGSGISLSWGSARKSLSILQHELEKSFNNSKEIAVIGAGVIGLTTAYLLVQQGWNVHIYASCFPPHTTSDVAPGIWNRILVKSKKMDKMLQASYADFKRLAQSKNPPFRGVTSLDIYTFKNNQHRSMDEMPSGTSAKGISLKASFEDGTEKDAMFYQTFLIDTRIYLADLYQHLEKAGVRLTQRQFESKQEMVNIPEKIIFNCTGMGAQKLFNDKEMVPIRGQLIDLKPQAGFDSMVAGPVQGEIDLYLIPLKDKIVLGGSYEMEVNSDQVDPAVCQQILENAEQFFNAKSSE